MRPSDQGAIPRRRLGSTAIEVSELMLGTMTFGASSTYMHGVTADERQARTILDRAIGAGIDFIDTANSYSQGLTETLLGQWLGTRREAITLATKVGMVIPEGGEPGPPIERGLGPNQIRSSCEASLRRLRTDRIDLLQLHMQDTSVPIADTLGACAELIAEGKVRFVGCSNYTGYRLTEALHVAERHGLPRFATIQLQWSLAVRDAEREMVPAARAGELGIIAWSPLARGFLSGKIGEDGEAPDGSRLSVWSASLDALRHERGRAILRALTEIARAHEAPPAAVAVAWLLSRGGLSAVTIGARTDEQLRENLRASAVVLNPDELRRLDEVSKLEWGYPYAFIEGLTGREGDW